MSPATLRAIKKGDPLTEKQFREYIDHEAKVAGIRGGASEAIKRAKTHTPSKSFAEERVRLLITTAALDDE